MVIFLEGFGVTLAVFSSALIRDVQPYFVYTYKNLCVRIRSGINIICKFCHTSYLLLEAKAPRDDDVHVSYHYTNNITLQPMVSKLRQS